MLDFQIPFLNSKYEFKIPNTVFGIPNAYSEFHIVYFGIPNTYSEFLYFDILYLEFRICIWNSKYIFRIPSYLLLQLEYHGLHLLWYVKDSTVMVSKLGDSSL